ncbi:hypothetical protein GQ54DRAFT_266360 [Martensiomyces pterosporus]|nr:hypothetical protein GQ54DRAFT_266360 [Martensiomyces pterosporus]
MVSIFEDGRPKFLRRRSSSSREADSTTGSAGAQQGPAVTHDASRAVPPPPVPPRRHDARRQSYQQLAQTSTRSSTANERLQALSMYLDEQQQGFHALQAPDAPTNMNYNRDGQASSSGTAAARPNPQPQSRPPPKPPADDKPPTTDRLVEFRLDIPNGVRNMTQHPNDTIVGSVVVTVTKPTKALRISLLFKGQERVYLLESAPHSPINLYTKTDYTLFEKRVSLWGKDVDDDQQPNPSSRQWETLPPGTLRVPFSIQIPHVNYPSTILRDKVCGVRYFIQASFERPGKLTTRSMSTPEEEIRIEPAAYPAEPRDVLRIDHVVPGSPNGPTSHIGVHISGGLSKLPAVAGDRVLYKFDALAVNNPTSSLNEDQHDGSADRQANHGSVKTLATSHTVRYMTIHIIEHLELRGVIKGIERTQTRRYDVYSARFSPNGQKQDRHSNSAPIFSTTGYIRLPVELCPFDSKLLTRGYELRIDCDIADKSSLLDKVTRSTATYSLTIPLNVCTISPENFTLAAYKNAYTDDSLNMSGIVPPPHHLAAAEPTVRVGGWEEERSHIEWDKNNPAWIELASRRNEGASH